ncbi:hypothetical protein K466DRAFT_606674 [Polyporus arcularius HHB13444]|uniref:Uncharacterized protein n=1 Tax=Polyporus arcularius HHB13444 TaxID=1314778 RepID=A0A5C3NQB1_9APHY|nr:hypothetical protein K466DRAFT_606674 [Polyporus arcularius HHB13444]
MSKIYAKYNSGTPKDFKEKQSKETRCISIPFEDARIGCVVYSMTKLDLLDFKDPEAKMGESGFSTSLFNTQKGKPIMRLNVILSKSGQSMRLAYLAGFDKEVKLRPGRLPEFLDPNFWLAISPAAQEDHMRPRLPDPSVTQHDPAVAQWVSLRRTRILEADAGEELLLAPHLFFCEQAREEIKAAIHEYV